MPVPFAPTSTGQLYRVFAGCILLAALGACGYKGPLYLPAPPPPDASLTAPPTPQALPSQDAAVESPTSQNTSSSPVK